jgi:hypothetical protein
MATAACRPWDVQQAAGTFEDPTPPCWCCGGPTELTLKPFPRGQTMRSSPATLDDLLAP